VGIPTLPVQRPQNHGASRGALSATKAMPDQLILKRDPNARYTESYNARCCPAIRIAPSTRSDPLLESALRMCSGAFALMQYAEGLNERETFFTDG
jgi:hypothetical protein